MAKRLHPTNGEIVAVHARLAEVLKKGEGDLFEYADGWDDERVQKECAPRLTPTHIGRLRVDLYGNIRRYHRSHGKADPVLASEVRVLRQTVVRLEERLARVEASVASGTPLLDAARRTA